MKTSIEGSQLAPRRAQESVTGYDRARNPEQTPLFTDPRGPISVFRAGRDSREVTQDSSRHEPEHGVTGENAGALFASQPNGQDAPSVALSDDALLADIRIVAALVKDLNYCSTCGEDVFQGTGFCARHLSESRRAFSAQHNAERES